MVLTNYPLSSFAVCADKNAGIRAQARATQATRLFNYQSKALKFHNRETSYLRGKDVATIGLSRAKSDNYARALHNLTTGRRMLAGIEMDRAKLQSAQGAVSAKGESRSNTYARNARLKLLNKRAAIERSIDHSFGAQYAQFEKRIGRQYKRKVAENRDAVGVTPEYGMPVMMPPKDKAGQNWANLQLALSIAGAAAGFVGKGG